MFEKLGGSYSVIFQVALAIATLIIPWAFTRTRSFLAFLDIKWSLLWLEGELSRLERFHTQSGSLVQFLLTQLILAGVAATLGWIFSSLGNVQGGVRLSVLLNLMFGFMAYGILVHAASMSFRFNQGEDYLNKLRSRIAALRDRLTEPKQA